MSDTTAQPDKPAAGLIATARNDITIPNYTTRLEPQDDTLIQRGGGRGLAIYDDIERDPFAHAALQKRKLGLIARQWEVEAASDTPIDEAAAELVRDILSRIPFDRLCSDLLDATLKGFAIVEIDWQFQRGRWEPARLVAHDQRRFCFDLEARPRLLTREAPMDGIELPERKFIVHRFGERGNDPYGRGLGSILFWCVLFKREGVAFWATFLEKFASPTPIGKYPIGTLPADQQRLLRALQDMVQAGALVAPIGTEVDFLNAGQSGSASYREWCEYWDRQMSLCVFGSTLGMDTQGAGSRAAADTHQEAEERIIDADGDLLSDTLASTLVRWLLDLNMPAAASPSVRRVRPKNEGAEVKLRKDSADAAKAALDVVFAVAGRVPAAEVEPVLSGLADAGFLPPLPVDVVRRLAPHIGRAPIPSAPPVPSVEPTAPGFAADDPHDHGMTALADQLDTVAGPAIADMLAMIRAELDTAIAGGEGYAGFARRLAALSGRLPTDGFALALAAATTVAELNGRADVRDEATGGDP